MEFYYENHVGEKIQFYNSPYVLTEHTFSDWKLSYDTVQKKSSGFRLEPVTKSFKVRLFPGMVSQENRETAFKKLYDAFVNVIAKDTEYTGKLYTTNGEYLVCRLITSTKDGWNKYGHVEISCTLLSDYPVWIHENNYDVQKRDSSQSASEFLDYAYGYDYDFLSPESGQIFINNSGYGAADYRLVIFGPVNNPYISINNIKISVDTVVADGEYLIIDSRERSVYRVAINGSVTNLFNQRNKEQSIFEKIPTGQYNAVWPGIFGFSLTIFEERREPAWS